VVNIVGAAFDIFVRTERACNARRVEARAPFFAPVMAEQLFQVRNSRREFIIEQVPY